MPVRLATTSEIPAHNHIRTRGPAVLVERGVLAFVGNGTRAEFEEEPGRGAASCMRSE
jgi:hypothetical protein